MRNSPFSADVTCDWEWLVDCTLGKATPERVYHIEQFLDRCTMGPSVEEDGDKRREVLELEVLF